MPGHPATRPKQANNPNTKRKFHVMTFPVTSSVPSSPFICCSLITIINIVLFDFSFLEVQKM